ncbi:MAG: hypothetical protein KF873_03520 [Gemmataceae bacterium]|nr:hypothetical protein [Gemmataceae bacterium]
MAATTSNDLTRHQLEELDALLQRMLAAPAPTPEPRRAPPPAVPPVVESWRIDRAEIPMPRLQLEPPAAAPAPSPASVPTVAFVPAEPPIPPLAPEPSLSEPLEEVFATVPVTPSKPFAPPLAPEPVPEPIALSAAEPAPRVMEIEFAIPPVVEASRIPLWMRPVQAVNWLAEETLVALGGESLTRPMAKWALGLAGLAMIGVAIAWVATGGRLVASFR